MPPRKVEAMRRYKKLELEERPFAELRKVTRARCVSPEYTPQSAPTDHQ